MKKRIRKTIILVLTVALLSSILIGSINFRTEATNLSTLNQLGPKMDHLQFEFYTSQDTLFTAMVTNQIDIMSRPLTKAQYQEALNISDIQLGPYDSDGYFEIAFNNNATDPSHTSYRKAMNYTEFRQAIACLIDKDGLVSGPDLGGFGTRIDTPIPRPAMDSWVNFNVSKYDSNGNLLGNYPWDYNETHALEILWRNDWYSHTVYPTLASLISAYNGSGLPLGSVVYPSGHPHAGQAIDTIIGYTRSDDAPRKTAGTNLATEMTKLGIHVNNTLGTFDALLPHVANDRDYDFYTGGWSMGMFPTYFYSMFTPAGIYPGGSNMYMIDDANLTYQATMEYPNATSISQSMNAALVCQDIIVQQAMLVPLYTTKSYYAYRKGLLGVEATKGCGLTQLLDYLMLNVQHENYPTVNTIRYGTMGPPDTINPIFSGTYSDCEVMDRIFTGYMNTNPCKSTVPGKSPAGGDLPWMAYDWKYEQGSNGNAIVTLWFNQSIKWQDGTPFTVDDLNYTIYLQQAYGDAWGNADFSHITNFTKIDDYTCKIYFNFPSIYSMYTFNLDIVPKHIYQYIAIPANASSGTTTTGHHGEWPGQQALSSEILPGAPFTYSQLTGSDGGKYTWVGTNMWTYHQGTYMSGGGGNMTLDANRNFFLYTPPAGEIDFQYYWNLGSPPQTGYYKIDQNDQALMNSAYGSIGNPPSSNWNPACNIATPSGSVGLTCNATLAINYGIQWGYSLPALPSAPSSRYPSSMFRQNPEHTGYTESPAPRTNQTRWNFTTESGVSSSPAVSNGRVYVGSGNDNVYCLDALEGTKVWNFTTGGLVESSPAVADGKVYVGSDDFNVYCLDAANGTKLWNYTTGDQVASSPAVADGKVYVGSDDGRVYCLDALNGAQVWNYTTASYVMDNSTGGRWVYSSPAVSDGRIYVGAADSNVYCLDAMTGVQIWNYTTGEHTASSPAVAEGKVYVGSDDFNVYCLDAISGAKVWNFTTGDWVESSPAVADGKVYVGSDDFNVYCLDAISGAKVWNFTTGDWVESSPAVADGKVYVGSDDSNVYCLDALNGVQVWKYTTGDWVYSSPAVADGMVFLGSYDGSVYAFGNIVSTENYGTVQAAINAATSGATILVAKGIYNESLSVNKTLTIIGVKGSNDVFTSGGSGIYLTLLSGASGSIVTGIVITNYDQGILAVNASNCKVYGNIMCSLAHGGVVLQGKEATGNLIYDNMFQDTPTAVDLAASGGSNTVYKNIINSQTSVSLNLQSNGNAIYANIISASQIVVNLTSSKDNIIFHNNFIATLDVTILTSGNNTWDDGYPSGGNYWSNYATIDLYSGANQNLPGSDGINDTKFIIDRNNTDRYPLVKPFSPHDIGIVNATLSKTVVGKGYLLCINATILNFGTSDEAPMIAAYGNTTLTTEQMIILTTRSCVTVTLTWNTTSFVLGNYNLTVCSGPVQDETDTTDNTFLTGMVKVTIPGDIDGSFTVDLGDLVILAKTYNSKPGDARWNPNADIDGSGQVDLGDLVILAQHYNQHYP